MTYYQFPGGYGINIGYGVGTTPTGGGGWGSGLGGIPAQSPVMTPPYVPPSQYYGGTPQPWNPNYYTRQVGPYTPPPATGAQYYPGSYAAPTGAYSNPWSDMSSLPSLNTGSVSNPETGSGGLRSSITPTLSSTTPVSSETSGLNFQENPYNQSYQQANNSNLNALAGRHLPARRGLWAMQTPQELPLMSGFMSASSGRF